MKPKRSKHFTKSKKLKKGESRCYVCGVPIPEGLEKYIDGLTLCKVCYNRRKSYKDYSWVDKKPSIDFWNN